MELGAAKRNGPRRWTPDRVRPRRAIQKRATPSLMIRLSLSRALKGMQRASVEKGVHYKALPGPRVRDYIFLWWLVSLLVRWALIGLEIAA